MNILIFSWRGPGHPNAGGAEIVTHEHAKAWVKAGHKVTLFTSLYSGAKTKEIIDGVQIIRESHDFGGVNLAAWRWYSSLKGKPDLVVDEFHGIPFFTPLYVKGKKLAFIHEVAKEVWLINHLSFPFNFIYGILGYLTEPLIFKLFYTKAPFMTVSESTKEDLIAWSIPARNISVIPNGITAIKLKVEKNSVKTCMYLGAIAHDKGIEDALETFSLISKNDKTWQFWVVGRGDKYYMELLKRKCKDLKISDKVKFWGYVSERTKFELLGKAHILVNPSVREGWGLVNIEAAFSGTPVVGYDVPGVKDSVINGKTGFLVAKGNTPGLALNCLELTEDKKKYEELRRGAITFSKKFSWEKSSRESLKLIERICKK